MITAKGYLEALARIEKMKFDLILADIFLDDEWGIDILKEVIQRNLQTRVTIMAAYLSSEKAQDNFRMPAVDYLVKPLRQTALVNSINKAFQH